ncbi:MAG: diphthamide synthesis protein [Nanoarchaeota archaeon]|nr:diphthamide synthesis protein [Nanoarchaeota archaeon]
MEVMFVPAKAEFDLDDLKLDRIKHKKLGLITTVQFVDELPKIKNHLTEKGFEAVIGGEILGCRIDKAKEIKDKVDAFLFIGSGHFHPIAMQGLGKPIYLPSGEIMKDKKKSKAMWIKFLSAKQIGIMISLKPGQRIKQAEKIKQGLEKKYPDKKFYLFLFDTLDIKQMTNFPFIEAWVNTACPRISDDVKVLNYEDLVLFADHL